MVTLEQAREEVVAIDTEERVSIKGSWRGRWWKLMGFDLMWKYFWGKLDWEGKDNFVTNLMQWNVME